MNGLFIRTFAYPLAFNNRDPEEYEEAIRFLAAHGKGKLFYHEDRGLGQVRGAHLLLGRRDSPVRQSPLASGGISFSFAFRVNDWTPPEGKPSLSSLVPAYGVRLPGT